MLTNNIPLGTLRDILKRKPFGQIERNVALIGLTQHAVVVVGIFIEPYTLPYAST